MSAQIIDGKAIAARVRREVAARTKEFTSKTGLKPGLAVVRVGDDAASAVYVGAKQKAAVEVGFNAWEHHLPATASQEDVLARVNQLNNDSSVHGILVQLPLPRQVKSDAILVAIEPGKDVDGFHPFNAGKLFLGQKGFKPCTPFGVMRMLQEIQFSVAGKKAVVVGRSNIVGKPMAMMLLAADATITLCHSKSQLSAELCHADLVVAAVGVPELIRGEWLKPGAVVIDVGMNRSSSGKLLGDVHFESASKSASFITPVPGGVGPMTVAMLLENTLLAAQGVSGEMGVS